MDDFNAYAKRAITEYANDKVRAGNWQEETAFGQAEEEFQRLLPNGLQTQESYLCWIVASEKMSELKVGVIWFAANPSKKDDMFIWDFEIFDEFRRKGYATRALDQLETKSREIGKKTISLHVFGQNQAARRLYEKCGFEETNVMMTKKI